MKNVAPRPIKYLARRSAAGVAIDADHYGQHTGRHAWRSNHIRITVEPSGQIVRWELEGPWSYPTKPTASCEAAVRRFLAHLRDLPECAVARKGEGCGGTWPHWDWYAPVPQPCSPTGAFCTLGECGTVHNWGGDACRSD